MSAIRPLEAADIPAVAGLYRTLLERRPLPAPRALGDYFSQLFLGGPLAHAETPSLVMVSNDRVTGFIGSTAQSFFWDGQPIRAAIASSLMVEDHARDPLAGVRLMKAFLAGPQDVSLTETAGAPTLAIWRQLGGHMMAGHSLDWMRILKPAQFGLAYISRRFKPAAMLSPVASALDRRAVKSGQPGQHVQWLGLPDDFSPSRRLQLQTLQASELPEFIRGFAAAFAVQPIWSPEAAARLTVDLARKPQFGPMHAAALRTEAGATIGGFIYFLDRQGVARVVQIFARPNQEGLVIDTLLSDAVQRGAIVAEGRITPQISNALAARRCTFFQRSVSAVHSRSPELVAAFESGAAMFNGVVGEYWTRLYGGEFDGEHTAPDLPDQATAANSLKGHKQSVHSSAVSAPQTGA